MTDVTGGRAVALIWAQGTGGVIGRGNAIPWHVPEDSRRFRELTVGHPVVMGRKTWDSLPRRFRPLPDRMNVVLTTDPTWTADGAVVTHDLAAAFDRAAQGAGDLTVVIGGSQIYAATMPFATTLYVTDIDVEIDGADAHAPMIDDALWERSDGAWLRSEKGVRYRFCDYRRKPA